MFDFTRFAFGSLWANGGGLINRYIRKATSSKVDTKWSPQGFRTKTYIRHRGYGAELSPSQHGTWYVPISLKRQAWCNIHHPLKYRLVVMLISMWASDLICAFLIMIHS